MLCAHFSDAVTLRAKVAALYRPTSYPVVAGVLRACLRQRIERACPLCVFPAIKISRAVPSVRRDAACSRDPNRFNRGPERQICVTHEQLDRPADESLRTKLVLFIDRNA